MPLEIQILLPAFVACLVLAGILVYLGLHVLARGIIFVDIALAQIAALGTAVASLRGVEPGTPESYFWSLGFTFVGALLFVLTRSVRRRVPQEAFIGITYAVAAALALLVANYLPHGDEEIKETLVGSLLTVSFTQVGIAAAIFAVIGAFHFVFRKKFVELSFDPTHSEDISRESLVWDLLFYVGFGVVITSAVQMAGVLLVFSFLIVPAVFSALFYKDLFHRLLLAWGLCVLVSATGLWGSLKLDLPTGAVVVVTFGLALCIAAIVRVLLAWKEKQQPGAEQPASSN